MSTHPPANGAAIRYWRQRRGVLPRDLAAAVRYSTSHLRNVEIGKRQPSAELLNRIADELRLDPKLLQVVAEEAA